MLTKSLCLVALFVLVVPSLFASAELPAKTKTYQEVQQARHAMIVAKSNVAAQTAKLKAKEIHLNSSRTIQQRQAKVVETAEQQWNEAKIAAEQASNIFVEKEMELNKLEVQYNALVAQEKAAREASKALKFTAKAAQKANDAKVIQQKRAQDQLLTTTLTVADLITTTAATTTTAAAPTPAVIVVNAETTAAPTVNTETSAPATSLVPVVYVPVVAQ
ncbi:hypothetical protein DdX_08110 [Ditylenchus destructor]|uniref:Uncharacterized protein n=1 Tax=Ditylenchus destructor TaxID=166010 RepID=A0AAD4N1M8_9BILA|nr:hypothetical protein DdX_08110 [Ditylenchus destructor]